MANTTAERTAGKAAGKLPERVPNSVASKLNDGLTSKKLAEAIRSECLRAAREAFMDASENGLCLDGAIEAASGAIQAVDTDRIVNRILSGS
ncbi:MAG: hypothetical protein ACNA8K_08560 [Cyclonatronaceae bacterium]